MQCNWRPTVWVVLACTTVVVVFDINPLHEFRKAKENFTIPAHPPAMRDSPTSVELELLFTNPHVPPTSKPGSTPSCEQLLHQTENCTQMLASNSHRLRVLACVQADEPAFITLLLLQTATPHQGHDVYRILLFGAEVTAPDIHYCPGGVAVSSAWVTAAGNYTVQVLKVRLIITTINHSLKGLTLCCWSLFAVAQQLHVCPTSTRGVRLLCWQLFADSTERERHMSGQCMQCVQQSRKHGGGALDCVATRSPTCQSIEN
jgi:hypothetical protein